MIRPHGFPPWRLPTPVIEGSVLRLLEKYSVARVAKAIEKSLRYRNPRRDVVVQYCISQEYPEVSTFNLAGRQHLSQVNVNPPELNGYNSLIGQEVMA